LVQPLGCLLSVLSHAGLRVLIRRFIAQNLSNFMYRISNTIPDIPEAG
jgi:hypothetical protein